MSRQSAKSRAYFFAAISPKFDPKRDHVLEHMDLVISQQQEDEEWLKSHVSEGNTLNANELYYSKHGDSDMTCIIPLRYLSDPRYDRPRSYYSKELSWKDFWKKHRKEMVKNWRGY